MNTKRYLLGSLVVFVFIFVYEFLLDGLLLGEQYARLTGMVRPDEESMRLFPFMLLGMLLLAFFFCYIFVKGREGTGIGEGVRFGFLIGVGFGVSASLIHYAVQPWPGSVVLTWVVGMPIEMMIAGVLIATIYKP